MIETIKGTSDNAWFNVRSIGPLVLLVAAHGIFQVWVIAAWDLAQGPEASNAAPMAFGYMMGLVQVAVTWSFVSREPLLVRLSGSLAAIWFCAASFTSAVLARTPVGAADVPGAIAVWIAFPLVLGLLMWVAVLLIRLAGKLIFRHQLQNTPRAGVLALSAAMQWLQVVALFAIAYWLMPVLPKSTASARVHVSLGAVLLITAVAWIVGNVAYLAFFCPHWTRTWKAAIVLTAILALTGVLVDSGTLVEEGTNRVNLLAVLGDTPRPTFALSVAAVAVTVIASTALIRLASSASGPATTPSVARLTNSNTAAMAIGLVLAVALVVSGMHAKGRFHTIPTSDDPELLIAGLEDSRHHTQDQAARRIRKLNTLNNWSAEQQERVRLACQQILTQERNSPNIKPSRSNKSTYALILVRFDEALPWLADHFQATDRGTAEYRSATTALSLFVQGRSERLDSETVRKWAADDHSGFRYAAVTAMTVSPKHAKPCAVELAGLLRDPNQDMQILAIDVILDNIPELRQEATAVLRALCQTTAPGPFRIRLAMIACTHPHEFRQEIQSWLRDPYSQIRESAVEAVMNHLPDLQTELLQLVTALLNSNDANERFNGLKMIESVYAAHGDMLQSLVERAAEDPDRRVRDAARRLSRIRGSKQDH